MTETDISLFLLLSLGDRHTYATHPLLGLGAATARVVRRTEVKAKRENRIVVEIEEMKG